MATEKSNGNISGKEARSQEKADLRDADSFIAEVRSGLFKKFLKIARQAAVFDSSVLLSGETGVGKEIVARYIHSLSPRKKGPIVTINCGALPETLLESELFGHKAGSFTGAIKDRVGLFEQAARGTVLLDEIGDVSQAIQVKLLRVLQEREILRVGENIPRKVDIRIIAATNRDLEEAIEKGKFRKDLLFRLRVIEIEVPPLRERPDDILPLTKFIIAKLSKEMNLPDLRLGPDCLKHLRDYDWPGNVRELQNAIERAAIFSGDGFIQAQHLPPQVTSLSAKNRPSKAAKLVTLADMEQNYINEVLQYTNGNRTKTAKILGIGQATLWRKLKKSND